ncbi:MAG TPA: PadR family transcriptional regulator [Thermomicrobiales bacterium]|nr:PadR family transcriptional regulator [Thermomicrobiales bacterium]
MSPEYILLGLLRREPRHGYDLAREFSAGTTLGEIIHLEPSMLYAYLKKLEQAGYIRATLQSQGPRPPRRIFELSEAGADELTRWLAEPVERTRDLRLEFLLKLYIARDDEPEIAAGLIAEQHDLSERLVESLARQIEDEQDDFRRLVLEMRLEQNRALLNWLAKARMDVTTAS